MAFREQSIYYATIKKLMIITTQLNNVNCVVTK